MTISSSEWQQITPSLAKNGSGLHPSGTASASEQSYRMAEPDRQFSFDQFIFQIDSLQFKTEIAPQQEPGSIPEFGQDETCLDVLNAEPAFVFKDPVLWSDTNEDSEIKPCGCSFPCDHDHSATQLDPQAEKALLAAELNEKTASADDLDQKMGGWINVERANIKTEALKSERTHIASDEDRPDWAAVSQSLSDSHRSGSGPENRETAPGNDQFGPKALVENRPFELADGKQDIADKMADLYNRPVYGAGHQGTDVSDQPEYSSLGGESGNRRVAVAQSLALATGEGAPRPSGESLETDSTSAPEAGLTPAIVGLRAFLIDAATDEILGEIRDGQSISLGDADPQNLSVLVENDSRLIKSIGIFLDGRGRIESNGAYALFGDSADPNGGRDIKGGEIGTGAKTLTLTAYDQKRGAGTLLDSETIEFTITASSKPPTPGPDPDPVTETDIFANGILERYTSGDAPDSSFNIDLRFNGDGWTEGIQRAFVRGAEFMSDIIIGDVRGRDGVDDILINVSLYEGERGGTLASAGPRGTNPDGTTSVGEARFDRFDALWLEDTLLDDVVVHEFFHALGLGTRRHPWEFSVYTYNREFPALSGENATSIPFTRGHLSEAVFDNELNTPRIDLQNYLSNTSVAILEDLGYDTYLDNAFDPNDLFGPEPENNVTEWAFV